MTSSAISRALHCEMGRSEFSGCSQDMASIWQRWSAVILDSYFQKTITFHFEFTSEIIENAQYEMKMLYSIDNLQFANQSLERINKIADN
jgi:hypothetical protein